MGFYADLHIHSKYSRACSRDCDLEHLAWWAGRKGVTVVGTGDFTHPAWFEELERTLVPAEPGLFRLHDDLEREVAGRLPPACRGTVRFMLSVEISTIYKRDDRTRKVHHLVYARDLDTVRRFNATLERIGNIRSDGRPILGLDSRDLLEITLESGDGAYLVPAHVWTPWFAVLGSMSGFDAIEECYADLAGHVFAAETGLSSDPAMNWRVSGLDRYRLVSNSDAHSPPMLGREATVFDTDVDYDAIRGALETGEGLAGTIEFFPEQGKYHLDGHRKCGVRLDPPETRARQGACPGCGKPVTVGVLHRVEALADREDGFRPERSAGFRSLVALPEIVGELLAVGPKSKRVAREVEGLVGRLGPELGILEHVPLDAIAAAGPPLLDEAIARLRRGDVRRQAGYDGEYGVIRLFTDDELRGPRTAALFAPEPQRQLEREPVGVPAVTSAGAQPQPLAGPAPVTAPLTAADPLDPEQRAAATAAGPLLIVAGPGTGKTRTLTHRIAHLVNERGAPPESVLAITFTRRAAAEMTERLEALVPDAAPRLTVTTFHGLGLRILREQHEALGLPADLQVAEESAPEQGRVDFDDLIALPVKLLDGRGDLVDAYRRRWRHVAVDEYQDVDELQYRLLRALSPADGDLCAIGDPDQAIYGFRGGDVGFFLRFRQDYPAAATVELTRNYRSAPVIVDAAVAAVRPESLVPGRRLAATARQESGTPVVVHEAPSERAEAEFVVASVDRLLGGSSHFSIDSGRADGGGGAWSFADFAVLARTKGQLETVGEAFERSGIPYQRRSHERLADRPDVEEIVARLRASGEQPFLGGLFAVPVDARVRAAAAGEDGLAEAVDLLAPLAQRCGGDLDRFLTELALGAEVDTLDPRADRVSLLTLHAAKGLEFPVVFLVGCEDGLLPLRWGAPQLGEDTAEERRLFFVGMTRARSRLLLSRAHRRLRHGEVRDAAPSPYLADLPAGLVLREAFRAPARPRLRTPEADQLLLW